jgi:SAM-dependent methyltransferase
VEKLRHLMQMNRKVIYVGKDLEAMSFAENYHRWILRDFAPYVGRRVVEVGAGTGGFSRLILSLAPQTLALVEPSEMFCFLRENLGQFETETQISFFNEIFTEVADKVGQVKKPDTIIYVNVLEHIEDDLGELNKVYHSLESNGHCLIFVPALKALYGKFDKKVGHFRRYDKKELENKAVNSGFKIIKSTYFDLFGVIPWFVKYRMLKSDGLGGGTVELYDRLVVPATKLIESFVAPPIGKNILLVLEKS